MYTQTNIYVYIIYIYMYVYIHIYILYIYTYIYILYTYIYIYIYYIYIYIIHTCKPLQTPREGSSFQNFRKNGGSKKGVVLKKGLLLTFPN